MSDVNNFDGSLRIVISDAGYEVPIENRPLWRLLMLCFCIKILSSDGLGLSSSKIRVAIWMVLRPSKWVEYKEFLFGFSIDVPKVMPDDNVEKAIQLGIAKKYFSISDTGRVELQDLAISLIEMADNVDVGLAEKDFLNYIKSKFTDAAVKSIIGE